MVNVLLAASPATRSRPQAIKGQEPGWWTFSFAAIRANAFAPQKAEVVNELLWDGGQKNVHQPWALALNTLSVRGREPYHRVVWTGYTRILIKPLHVMYMRMYPVSDTLL